MDKFTADVLAIGLVPPSGRRVFVSANQSVLNREIAIRPQVHKLTASHPIIGIAYVFDAVFGPVFTNYFECDAYIASASSHYDYEWCDGICELLTCYIHSPFNVLRHSNFLMECTHPITF